MKTVVSTLEIGDRRLSSPDFIMFLEDVCKYVREDYKSRVGDENSFSWWRHHPSKSKHISEKGR